ncbi:uncharacterized protein LOC104908240 [Beta vulgaris subsp. vulgaris]|uniref:uncharacterized protein LOC104908240 n=1 Tax=Beta vulgaris subsp. vulgaris TaxID=3555 RepID=UPI002548688E|nr:uncharacterized protein LOC104908240 [Beta vulgaris subsp. vulgaris]
MVEIPKAAMAKKLATLKPPIFVGKEDPLLLENWLRDFDKLFTATGTPEAQKVDQATFYLREDADTWWESQGPIVRAQENFNWNAFKVAIKDRFFPEHIRRQKYNEFTRFNQGDERAKAQKFEDGLAFRIQTRLGGATSQTFQEAYAKASNIERILRREEEVMGRNKRKDPPNNQNDHENDKKPRYGGNNNNEGNDHNNGDGGNNTQHNGQNNNRANGGNNNQNGNGNGARGNNGRIYVMNQNEADTNDNVVMGTFLVNSNPAYMLFDSRASRSFIASLSVEKLGKGS